MAARAKPALKPIVNDKTEAPKVAGAKPLTLTERIVRKLTEIFEHNERLGTTRQ